MKDKKHTEENLLNKIIEINKEIQARLSADRNKKETDVSDLLKKKRELKRNIRAKKK